MTAKLPRETLSLAENQEELDILLYFERTQGVESTVRFANLILDQARIVGVLVNLGSVNDIRGATRNPNEP